MQALHHSVVIKRELSRKAKLLMFNSLGLSMSPSSPMVMNFELLMKEHNLKSNASIQNEIPVICKKSKVF